MSTMAETGEKAFIKSLLPQLTTDPSFVNGFGHDASIVDIGLDELIACKIDRAPFPVSLEYGFGDYKTWGRLATVANVSDILAVGAEPKALMLSLVLPRDFAPKEARQIVMGCQEACLEHGLAFVGGDTKEGETAQVIGAAWGTVKRRCYFGRGKAEPGDALFVAGKLGAFSASLELVKAQTANDCSEEWKRVLTLPAARINEAVLMRQSHCVAHACDLSDGLSEAISLFCSRGVGIRLNENKLPLHSLVGEAANTTGIAPWKFAMAVGDWAIAFIIKKSDIARFKAGLPENSQIFELGHFNKTGRQQIVTLNNQVIDIPPIVNEHFKLRAEDNAKYFDTYLTR